MNLEAIILETLQQPAPPLKAAEIVKRIKPQAGRDATPKAVTATLEMLAGAGRLHRINAGKAALFTTQSLELAAAALVKQTVHAAKKEVPAAALKKKLPPALHSSFEAALATLSATGDVFVLPGAKRLVYARPPRPSELLSVAQRRTLQRMLDSVNVVRPRPAMLDDLLAWLDAVPLPEETVPPPDDAVHLPDEALLRQWYAEDSIRSSTVMIPIPRTFERYASWAHAQGGRADSQFLRNLLETLYNEGRLLLEPCERPQDLPEHERALLVPMALGPPGYSWCWIS